jgi:hypothetical protein
LLIVAGLQVPVMPLVDVVGSTGAVLPAQKGRMGVNTGTTRGLTVTLMVVAMAHCPAAGVKVCIVVAGLAVLITAGAQVPAIPLLDTSGKTGGTLPTHNVGMGVKAGVAGVLTVTVNVVVSAHWPGAGVKVYVPVTVLLTVAGFQVPVMALVEVVGSTGATAPLHMGATGLKAGTIVLGCTDTVSVVVVAHCPAVGVNV